MCHIHHSHTKHDYDGTKKIIVTLKRKVGRIMNTYEDGELIVLLGLVLKRREDAELSRSRLSAIRFSGRSEHSKKIAHYESLQKKIGLALTTSNKGQKHRFSDVDATEFSALAIEFREEIEASRLEEEVSLKRALERIIDKVMLSVDTSKGERELVNQA